MRILSLETSLRQGSVAALVGSSLSVEVSHELLLPANERSAQTLLPTISRVLSACHWQPVDIELICVTTGPGSFTGLRIGVTAAKTLAFATGAKLVGVHTLSALASGVPDHHHRRWAIMDAQRQELFVARFEGPQIPGEPDTRIVAVEDWLTELKPGDWVVGPAVAQLVDRLPPDVKPVDPKYWQPQAGIAGELGCRLFEAGHAVDPIQLVPNYYRKSAAEEKATRKHKIP